VHVNHSAGVYFAADTADDLVVALGVDDAHVRDGISEVTDLASRLLGRDLQDIVIRFEVIVGRREVDDRVHSRVDE